MSKHIYFCQACITYTMKEKCPSCSKQVHSTRPAKYSPEDKWGKYRRIAKKNTEDL